MLAKKSKSIKYSKIPTQRKFRLKMSNSLSMKNRKTLYNVDQKKWREKETWPTFPSYNNK